MELETNMAKTKTHAEAPAKAAPGPMIQKQPQTPEKQAGSVPTTDTTTGMLPPPQGEPATTRAADLMMAPAQGISNSNRARMMASMQRTVGNARLSRLLNPTVLTKLTVGAPNDLYEQEADRVADAVMRMPEAHIAEGAAVAQNVQPLRLQRLCPVCQSTLQRQPMDEEEPEESPPPVEPIRTKHVCPECEEKLQRQPLEEDQEEETLQAKEVSGGTPEVPSEMESYLNTSRGGGQPLAESTRRSMESRFGNDFSGVRVHTDSRAVGAARDLNAQAFTRGQDIYFGAGRYQPGTPPGQRLLAHELTHVVQQGGGRLQETQMQANQMGTQGDTPFASAGGVSNPAQLQQRLGNRGALQFVQAQLPRSSAVESPKEQSTRPNESTSRSAASELATAGASRERGNARGETDRSTTVSASSLPRLEVDMAEQLPPAQSPPPGRASGVDHEPKREKGEEEEPGSAARSREQPTTDPNEEDSYDADAIRMGMSGQLKAGLEQLGGIDLSGIRVHRDSPEPTRIGADAYTYGRDIYLGPGQESQLPHEGWHAVQQMQGRVEPKAEVDGAPVNADSVLEREADVMGQRASRREQSDASAPPRPAREAPRRRGVVQAKMRPHPRPDMIFSADTEIVGERDIDLFPQADFKKTWEVVPETFVPLAQGTFLVSGIPISFGLKGKASANSAAFLRFGPGKLDDVRVFVRGELARRMRDPGIYVIPGLPPLVLPRGRPRLRGSFEADAMLEFGAGAGASIFAQAELAAQLGVFGDMLNAGAFAGIWGHALADASTDVRTHVYFRWNDRTAVIATTLDLQAALRLAFTVAAYAGVWIELKFPEIPVVTSLSKELDDWPIVGWFVPDLSEWKWRKEYRKDWPLFQKSYDWQIDQHFEIGGTSPSAKTKGDISNSQGFSIQQLLKDLMSKQRDGDLKDDAKGPGEERRDSDPSAVQEARAAALAQISSAKRAAAREKRANDRLLNNARARARSAASGEMSGPSGPPPLAMGSASSGSGPSDPVGELEKRGEKLDQATRSAGDLRKQADDMSGPASAADGPSRNQARAGYEAIGKNADNLGDKIDQAQGPFEIPGELEPDTADYERMRKNMRAAYDAFDKAYDPVRTEKLWADSQVREAGKSADLKSYRDAAVVHRREALKLWQKVLKLESDLEKAREWYERHDHALGAKVFDELENKALNLEHNAGDLEKDRPVPDWDTEFVELVGGQLLLQPSYRGKATRRTFYPHDYSSAVQERKMREIGGFRSDPDGTTYWEYRRKRSPRGDYWWLLNDEFEQPTLDHTSPTVVTHWNTIGRRVDRATRRAFYNFESAPLVVVPKTENSSAGGREPGSYTPRVTSSFRGR
jgi:hypothetical protein